MCPKSIHDNSLSHPFSIKRAGWGSEYSSPTLLMITFPYTKQEEENDSQSSPVQSSPPIPFPSHITISRPLLLIPSWSPVLSISRNALVVGQAHRARFAAFVVYCVASHHEDPAANSIFHTGRRFGLLSYVSPFILSPCARAQRTSRTCRTLSRICYQIQNVSFHGSVCGVHAQLPFVFRSSARASRAALTRGASVASGSAV